MNALTGNLDFLTKACRTSVKAKLLKFFQIFGGALVLALPLSSRAAEFGLSVAASTGTGESDASASFFGPGETSEFDHRAYEIGLVWHFGDQTRLFNNRLHLAYTAGNDKGIATYAWDGSRTPFSEDFDGLMLTNTFGFKISGNDASTIRLGPSLYFGSLDYSEGGDTLAIGIGPTLQINFESTGSAPYISLELAGKYVGLIGGPGPANPDITEGQLRLSLLWGE